MRAVSVDSDAAQLMGINVNRTISFTFALGSALAGAGGVLIGFVLQLDQAFDGDDTRDQSLCRSRSWRNRNHSRCCPRWICYRFCWKPSLQRSVFQTSVMPLCMPS